MEIQGNELIIKIPSGMEIDKENSTFECIKFKPIENKLPKTWEEYCTTHKRQYGEFWLTEDSNIGKVDYGGNKYYKDIVKDRNLLPSEKLAEAILALCQLIQLRDCYNDGWVPDWARNDEKYTIYVAKNVLVENTNINVNCILAFKTEELRDEFFTNFKDLLEVAKPLL